MEHWAKKFFEKITPKHVQNTFGQFGNNFGHFWNFEKFLIFYKNISKTRPSMEHWAKKKFSKKLPQNMFKTRLDNFGNDFGHFWNFEIFLFFWKHLEDSTLHGTLGKKTFRKNYLKTCSKHVWTLLGTILGIFGILKTFDFLKIFRRLDPTWNTGQKVFRKNYPKTCSKQVWTFLGTILGVFGNLKIF